MKLSLTPQIMKATKLTEQKPQLFCTIVGEGSRLAGQVMSLRFVATCHGGSK